MATNRIAGRLEKRLETLTPACRGRRRTAVALGILGACALGQIASTAHADLICKNAQGALFQRKVCNAGETMLTPAAFGAGPQPAYHSSVPSVDVPSGGWDQLVQVGADVPQAAVPCSFAADRLSGRASSVPLGEALRALQHAAGGELTGLRAVEHEVVSFDVADLPLEQALASLLRHRNFMAVVARESDGDRLVRLVIGAGGESEPGESTRRDPSVSAPTLVSAPANEPIGKLHSRALHGQSPGDRIAAIEALGEVGAAEDPERVTATLQAAVEGDPDPRVRQAALEGLRARDALGLPLSLDAARHDSEPAIRLAVLEDLRARHGGSADLRGRRHARGERCRCDDPDCRQVPARRHASRGCTATEVTAASGRMPTEVREVRPRLE